MSFNKQAWELIEGQIVKSALLLLGVNAASWKIKVVTILAKSLSRKLVRPVFYTLTRKGYMVIKSGQLDRLQRDLDEEQNENEFDDAVDAMY